MTTLSSSIVEPQTSSSLLDELTQETKAEFSEQKHLLSFDEYLELFFEEPERLARDSARYLKEMIDFFGVEERVNAAGLRSRHFSVFEHPRFETTGSQIVGQETAHDQIYRILEQFVRQGKIDKLILLHGPNGSSKSSTAEALALGLEDYARRDEGAVYRFNWVFPNDKLGSEGLNQDGAGKQIGFGEARSGLRKMKTFAHLGNDEIMCKLISEMKENPIFLLPREARVRLYQRAVSKRRGCAPDQVELPRNLIQGALSSKSKKIYDTLLVAYKGDLQKVYQHVQVERFFYSRRYRAGIAFVEPQMNADAHERQVTMDKHIQNLPTVLQDLRIFEPSGELIDANRGFIEFSDLLKRPIDAFKYLLTTIEKRSLNLQSGVLDLDLVMIGSTNEKHLDAFKASPDWAAFKGRFELVRVPYLLSSKLERRIYEDDFKVIQKSKPIAPHTMELLAKWAVLTRLKQPDPEYYDYAVRSLVSRLTPFDKLALYDNDPLRSEYSDTEVATLRKLTSDLHKEAGATIAYEGRFGASPREMKMMLHFAAQDTTRDSVSALAVFGQIERLMSDRSVYDYLQFEPRNGYHDYHSFLKNLKLSYAKSFYREFLSALNLFDEEQHLKAFKTYLKHVVAQIKGDKVHNEITGRAEPPNDKLMHEIEALMKFPENKAEGRQAVVTKMAGWRVENPNAELDVGKVFEVELKSIYSAIFADKHHLIERAKKGMLMFNTDDYNALDTQTKDLCEKCFSSLEHRFGYTRATAWETLVFLQNYETSL